MRLLAAFVRHEARTQMRSLRYRVFASLYVLLLSAPAFLVRIVGSRGGVDIGVSTHAAQWYSLAPALTAVFAALTSVDLIVRERDEGSLAVIGLAPMTNAGYLLRRWASALVLILPLSFAPVVVNAAAAGADTAAWGAFLWPWLLHVAPVALAASALALGLGTISGGIVAAAFAGYVVLTLGVDVANRFLAMSQRTLESPLNWIDIADRGNFVYSLFNTWMELVPATSAPVDSAAMLGLLLPRAALACGLAALFLAAATAFLRRTRPDNRPLVVRADHPLRTGVRLLNRFREEYGVDPALAASDRLTIAIGVLAFAGSVGWLLARDAGFRQVGETRYTAELGGQPLPSDAALEPVSWALTGEIGADGGVNIVTSARFRNAGAAPAAHLAFTLDPGLALTRVEPERGSVSTTRAWDRLAVDLTPPLAPGESRALIFRTAGRPVATELPFYGSSFAAQWENFKRARFAYDLTDLSRSRRVAAITARQVTLNAWRLAPVPRYLPWTLTGGGAGTGDKSRAGVVPPETIFHPLDFSVDLRTPSELFLADSLGHTAHGRESRLAGRGRIAVAHYTIRGGPLVEIPDVTGIGSVAALPAHVKQMQRHLASLTAASELARSAWPGIDPLPSCALLEWAPPFSLDPTSEMEYWWDRNKSPFEAMGRLVLLPERAVIRGVPFSPEQIAAAIVTGELVARRPLDPAQGLFFEQLFGALARARFGQGQQSAVVAQKVGGGTSALAVPLLGAGWEDGEAWAQRLPAVLADLQQRVGEHVVTESVEEFLAAGGAPGSARELFDIVARRSGEPLDRFFDDFVAGEALPQLTLEGVRFHRQAAGWEASGSVRNTGTGESLVRIVLRTELEPVSADLRVAAHEAVPFTLRTRSRPRVLLLDPDGATFRYRPLAGVVDDVEFQEGG